MINRERGSYPWGASYLNLELMLRGKYDACIDLACLLVGGSLGKIKNIPPFLFFLLFAQKKETKKRAAKSACGGPLFLAGQRT